MNNKILISALFVCISSVVLYAQTAATSDFNSIPLIVGSSKAAFEQSKTKVFNGNYMYENYSDQIKLVFDQIQTHCEPYKKAAENKAVATNAPAAGAAADFADLNSPAMQEKIAKMSQEEKVKFAMEVQQRMAANKNVQQINQLNKPDPLLDLSTRITNEAQRLASLLADYKMQTRPDYSSCEKLCSESNPVCYKIVSTCQKKKAKDYYKQEMGNYADMMKKNQELMTEQKGSLAGLLQEYDAESKKYKTDDIHASAIAVYTAVGTVLDKVRACEESGALLMVDAKNNSFAKGDF